MVNGELNFASLGVLPLGLVLGQPTEFSLAKVAF
jgi:hypothetical protein